MGNQVMKEGNHTVSGPRNPAHGRPSSEWPTVLKRVLEKKASLRNVADDSGVSPETIRRVVRAARCGSKASVRTDMPRSQHRVFRVSRLLASRESKRSFSERPLRRLRLRTSGKRLSAGSTCKVACKAKVRLLVHNVLSTLFPSQPLEKETLPRQQTS